MRLLSHGQAGPAMAVNGAHPAIDAAGAIPRAPAGKIEPRREKVSGAPEGISPAAWKACSSGEAAAAKPPAPCCTGVEEDRQKAMLRTWQ